MPTYEYECSKCGHAFERFQSMLDKPLQRCPECKGKVKRLLGTGSGIIFKGSGFYETDYKRKSDSATSTTKDSDSASKPKTETATTPASTTPPAPDAKPAKKAVTS